MDKPLFYKAGDPHLLFYQYISNNHFDEIQRLHNGIDSKNRDICICAQNIGRRHTDHPGITTVKHKGNNRSSPGTQGKVQRI